MIWEIKRGHFYTAREKCQVTQIFKHLPGMFRRVLIRGSVEVSIPSCRGAHLLQHQSVPEYGRGVPVKFRKFWYLDIKYTNTLFRVKNIYYCRVYTFKIVAKDRPTTASTGHKVLCLVGPLPLGAIENADVWLLTIPPCPTTALEHRFQRVGHVFKKDPQDL